MPANPWDPQWQPNWTDVHFDAGLAQQAIAALGETAAQLEAAAAERRKLADTARQHWTGRFREDFDRRFDGSCHDADRLVGDLRAAAAHIQAAAAQAQQDQQQRTQDRGRWQQEQASNYQQWQIQQQQQQALATAGAT